MAFINLKSTEAPVAPATATKKQKSEFAGVGALVQAAGLVAGIGGAAYGYQIASPKLFAAAIVVGLVILAIGGRMALKMICSACGNRVEKSSRVCPHCRASFR